MLDTNLFLGPGLVLPMEMGEISDAEEANEYEADASDAVTDKVSTAGDPSADDALESTEFALKLVNSVRSMNSGEITHYELINSFSMADELKCLILFVKALPYEPIVQMYPEAPFLFFKGVAMPRSFNLSENDAIDIENYAKGKNSQIFEDMHLHDLDDYYLDGYENAIRIYNDMMEKTRNSYFSSVKQAKSQVLEISAALVCGFVIILVLLGLS